MQNQLLLMPVNYQISSVFRVTIKLNSISPVISTNTFLNVPVLKKQVPTETSRNQDNLFRFISKTKKLQNTPVRF